MKDRLLEGKNIVITGCNRGIGKAILEKCASEGANVFAVVRRENEGFDGYAAGLEKQHAILIHKVYADFENEEEVKNAARHILMTKMPIHGLVNNIGVAFPQRALVMTKMQEIKDAFVINLFSPMFFTQQLLRGMQKARESSVVFISSSAAFDGGANIEYSASKAAIIGEVKRLAVEFGRLGIRVNAVAPGLTDTDMGVMEKEDEEKALSMNIMGRKGKPEEIAGAVLFLLSELSSFMTAQVMRVDGGLR